MLFASKASKIEKYAQKKNSAKLIPLLKDSKTEIHIQAIKALGTISDDKAVNELIALLSDPDPAIRLEVIKSMGNMGNQSIKSHLQHLIQVESDETMKQAIRDSIARIPKKN